MKKVLSIVLAIAMIATMSAVAFANPVSFGGEDVTAIPAEGYAQDITVKGVYTNDGLVATYKVDVAWDEFTYTFTSGKTWNPTTYTWDLTDGDGEWTIADKYITITNHSGEKVNVTADYVGEGEFTFDGEGDVATASKGENEVGAAVEAKIKATFVPGEYTIKANNDNMGTITVTIK